MVKWVAALGAIGVFVSVSGCGYTEEEMAAKQREINALTAELHSMRTASVKLPPTRTPSRAGAQARTP